MRFFTALLISLGLASPVIAQDQGKQPDQAVLVYLDGHSLPDEIYKEYDLATIEDQLDEILKNSKSGELDGHEFAEREVILFLYGKDARKLFSSIRSALEEYPLCKGARVVLRFGPPGSKQEELKLP